MISSFVVFSFWLHPQEQNEWTEQSYKNLSKISEMTKKKKTPHKYIDYHITFLFQNVYHCNHLPIHIAFTMGWKHPVKKNFLVKIKKKCIWEFNKIVLRQTYVKTVKKSHQVVFVLSYPCMVSFHWFSYQGSTELFGRRPLIGDTSDSLPLSPSLLQVSYNEYYKYNQVSWHSGNVTMTKF